jgi:hypothetical protein
MGVLPKVVPGAVVTALLLLLAAVMATAALGKPGPGGDDDDRRATPPSETKATSPVTPPVPDGTVVTVPPATPSLPVAPSGQAQRDQAPGTATGTASDPSAVVAPAAPPVLGRSMAVTPVAGRVQVRLPKGKGYVALSDAGSIPTGSVIDARQGRLELTTALAGGRTQTATFWGAVFEIRQARGTRGMTDLVLKGGRPVGCPSPAGALGRIASVSLGSGRTPAKSGSAGLWAKDSNGRFRSRGRNSVATVRWLTREICAGTLTRVAEGAVEVGDTRRRKTVLVRAGHRYLARDTR